MKNELETLVIKLCECWEENKDPTQYMERLCALIKKPDWRDNDFYNQRRFTDEDRKW